MGKYKGLEAHLIWDGGNEVHIPVKMGQPKAGQMEGTTAERLTELCGRVCYDPATEFLTKAGWVRADQLKKGVAVATYNALTDRMEFQLPTEYIRERHKGEMYRVHSTKVSLFVTPEHRLFVREGAGSSNTQWELRPAAEMKGKPYHVLRHAIYEGGPAEPILMRGRTYQQQIANAYGKTGRVIDRTVDDVLIDVHQLPAWATLLGYYVSAGSLNMNEGTGSAPVVAIYQKEQNAGPIIEAAEACGLRPRTAADDPRNGVTQIRVGGSTLAHYLIQFGKGSRKKRLPDYVFEWPTELRERLLDALMAGNGTTTAHGTRVYNTNSKGLADDVQRLIISLGRPANINYSQGKTCLMYRVRETAHREASVNKHRVQDSLVDYDGEVFCVSVPNRILVTRRDDKVVLCGNCYDSLGIGRPSSDYFDHILQVGHLSIAEHYNATVEITGSFTPATFMALLNRPWVWVTYQDASRIRVTTNLRGVREWEPWSQQMAKVMPAYPTAVASGVGLLLRDLFSNIAPRIVKAPPKDEVWPTMKMIGLDSAKLVEPENNAERWITVYMVGSRGFCYDAQTEVLTRDGWKAWPDVTGDEEFATMRMADGSLEYQRATDHIVEPYHGRMYRLSSQTVDLFVTPNHRMVVKEHDTSAARSGEGSFKILTAEEVAGRRLHYKRTAEWTGESPEFIEIPSVESETAVVNQTSDCGTRAVLCASKRLLAKPFARFLGYWLAEGHLDYTPGSGYMTVLTQKVGGRAWDGMLQSITEMGLTYSINTSATCPQIRVNGGQALYEFLRPFSGAENKGIPQEVKNWAPEYQRDLIEAYLEGVGSFTAEAEIGEGHTVSRRLADDLQEAALKAGWSANIRIVDRREEDTPIKHRRVCYAIDFSKDRGAEPLVNHNGKKHDSWEHYSGMIYCVTVPNGTLYVRRNGKPCWSGNSHEQVRHGDFTAISQRSTRYCEESESDWVIHPLIQEYIADEAVAEVDRKMADQLVNDIIAKCRHGYRWWVDKLVPYVMPRLGNDPYAKTTARKQARGAARGLLGNALETEVIFSAAVFQWQHMLNMRCAAAADAEIRNEFVEVLPLLKASRYGAEFERYVLEPAPDGVGMALQGGGHK